MLGHYVFIRDCGNATSFISRPSLPGFISPNPIYLGVWLIEVSENRIHQTELLYVR
jgi:hypothetical protein